MEDIITKDREEFLIYEMKFFRFRNLERFKKYMKNMDIVCEKCQVYHWKGCQKRCKC